MSHDKVGWLKLHRVLIDKPIWLNSTPEQKVVLVAILMLTKYEDHEYEWDGQKYKGNAGQFFTSLESIRKNCGKGVSIQNVRSSLNRFENMEFLTNESTKGGRLITICNWESYNPQKDDG